MKKKSITIRDVAREAGVSVATVSRFLNNVSYISEETGMKIRQVMQQLDYRPNEIARGLAMKKTNTIALIVPDITNPFFPELVVAIEDEAKTNGYNLILVNSSEDEMRKEQVWRDFQNRYIDGFIIASYAFHDQALLRLKNIGIPFVSIDRAASVDSVNAIEVNNYEGAVLAVEHLIEVGCKTLAHISGPQHLRTSTERTRGYIDAVRKFLPHRELIVYEGDFSLESGKRLGEQLMREHPDVDGLFLANDIMAIGCLKAFKSLNIAVPDDVAVVGFDGIRLTEMVEPELTTIQQPIYEIGVAATRRLLDLINQTSDDVKIQELKVRLVQRTSTARSTHG